MIGLKFQFDRDLKEKNPPEFKYGLERQQGDLKRKVLMKMKNVLASSTDQSGIIEKQEISEGNCNKVKGCIKIIHDHFKSCVGKDKVIFFYLRL